jgi:hypothetical protein
MKLPFLLVCWLTELPFSRRGLAVLFLAAAGFLVQAGWLHPPLSPDIPSLRIPLGAWGSPALAPEQILRGPRQIVLDSPGVLLLALLAVGMVVVLIAPRWIGVIAGLLLCLSLAANAAVALNHPALVELLDSECEQRQTMTSVFNVSADQVMTTSLNPRIHVVAADTVQPGDLSRGWVYLLYGRWLVLWAVGGLLLGTPGPARRGWLALLLWTVGGMALSIGVGFRRLHAEYYWQQAQVLEGRCQEAAARAAVARAVSLFPEFERMERTWLLLGKLDYRAHRVTPQSGFFRVYQLARNKERPQALADPLDLPSLANRSEPEELSVPPSGVDFGLTEPAFPVRVPDNDVRSGLSPLQGGLASGYSLNRALDRRRMVAAMDDLRPASSPFSPVRRQAAWVLTTTGLTYFRHAPVFTDSGTSYFGQNRGLMAAQVDWQRAAQVDPDRRDTAYYLGIVLARTDPNHPELAEKACDRVLTGLADRTVRADLLSNLGDAYFEAGQTKTARRRYATSSDAYTLPEIINYRAQRGLGGF